MLRTLLLAAVAVCSAGLCGTIAAQAFPAKPIRIIVPSPAGGTSDILITTTGEADLLFNGMLATLPDTPVVAETPGLEGFVTGSWQGVLAPAKTPPELVARLQTEISRIIHTPDMKEKLSSQGADPIGNSPAEMAKWLAAEKDRWAKLIKATGFKLEQ